MEKILLWSEPGVEAPYCPLDASDGTKVLEIATILLSPPVHICRLALRKKNRLFFSSTVTSRISTRMHSAKGIKGRSDTQCSL